MKIRFLAFLPLFVALAASSVCRADTTYTLTDVGGSDPGLNLVFDNPSGLISSGNDVIGGTCTNGDGCNLFTSTAIDEPFDEWDDNTTAFGNDFFITFAAGAFSSDGTYLSTGQLGTLEGAKLVVSGGVAATPEPSSFMLLGTGVAGIVGVLRRRRLI
jgi:hypothetical protein